MRSLVITHETWPLRGTFRISRGAKRESDVITVTISDGNYRGRGEGTPYARYGENIESTSAQIEQARIKIESGVSRQDLLQLMPPGAARNAVDCALWDLEAKQAGRRAWELADLPMPEHLDTAYSISLDSPETMAQIAKKFANWPVLKLKLAGDGDIERVSAVREAAPNVRLIVDANEAWTADMMEAHMAALAKFGVDLIEQPLPVGSDASLANRNHTIRICADESCHTAADIPFLATSYDVVNIKLDKTGGLTEAVNLLNAAQAAGLGIMVGCMVSSSLSMAPAMLLATKAEFIDLDGPLLLAKDRAKPIEIDCGRMQPPVPELWG